MDSARQGTSGRFTVRQKAGLKSDRYTVSELLPDGSDGGVLAFAEVERLSLKEEMTFYADESRTRVLFTVEERSLLDAGDGYDVRDAEGGSVGAFEERFFASLLRSTWVLHQQGSPPAVGRERNRFVAVLRRAWGFLPLDLVPFLWPYHFDFETDGKPVMRVDKKFGLRDRYVVDVVVPDLDRRLAIAQAVALDALQGR
ncbi:MULTISPECIES: hypothetical protein [Streptomyces]|uniref:hypothetical protein n=1 Tax=Streptomyces TaxID=1883 RepID=UPI0004C620E7|nr:MULTISPECIES: hypothetical protein [Streptomyces]